MPIVSGGDKNTSDFNYSNVHPCFILRKSVDGDWDRTVTYLDKIYSNCSIISSDVTYNGGKYAGVGQFPIWYYGWWKCPSSYACECKATLECDA